jgi:hypothetical protein
MIMDKPHNYKHHGMGEGHPGDIDPDETGRTDPSKYISETEKLRINQSGLGRDQGQTPADEHIESFSQVDDDTRQMRDEEHEASMKRTMEKEFDTSDFNRVDERDNADSSADWDAERSRTGRHR